MLVLPLTSCLFLEELLPLVTFLMYKMKPIRPALQNFSVGRYNAQSSFRLPVKKNIYVKTGLCSQRICHLVRETRREHAESQLVTKD